MIKLTIGAKVSREFLEKIRDRLMAIPIKEYYAPNRRKAILDEMIKVFIENGFEVEGKEREDGGEPRVARAACAASGRLWWRLDDWKEDK